MKKTTLSLLITFIFSSQVTAQVAPGGVSTGLNYWLKADAGVTLDSRAPLTDGRASQWANQTSTGGHISQATIARQPRLVTNSLNFNPALAFNTSGSDFDFLSTDDLVWDSDTVILVFNPKQSSGNGGTLQTVLVYNIPNNRFGDAGIGIGSIAGSGSDNFFNSTDITPAQRGEYIATSRVSANTTDDAILAVVRQNVSVEPTRSEHRFWGQETAINISNENQYASHQNTEFTIGQRDGGGLPFDGDVLEAISYSTRLDDASLRRIESYLSIKYGLTLNQSTRQDYLDSSDNTIYDAEGALSGFVSNIAGIGRDDDSGLNQKQSSSSISNAVQIQNSSLVTIGLGTVAETNALNANSFTSDQSFMLWGNNAATTNLDIPLTLSTITVNRMQRVWAIEETGTIGSVQLSIPKSNFNNDLVASLIVSANSSFNDVKKIITLQDDGGANYQANIDFDDGDFFTFAQSEMVVRNDTEFFITPLQNGDAVIFGL